MTEIDTKSNVFMTTTKVVKNLFPPLNDTLSLNSENQSKFKSSPSVSSFVALDEQKKKARLNEKNELLNIEEKVTKISITPAATKQSHSQLGNYDSIKNILLNFSATTTVIDASHNHLNRVDSIDSWSATSNIDKRKSNYQKYFPNSNRTPSQKSTTTPTSIATITPLELVSLSNRINETKLKPPFEIIGKNNLTGANTQSTKLFSETEATISPHHFPDWQLHLLNYKLKKGHYLKPTDLNRLLNTTKRLSRFGLNSSCSNDTYFDDTINKSNSLADKTSNDTNNNPTTNSKIITFTAVAAPLTSKSFNSDNIFTVNGIEIFVDDSIKLKAKYDLTESKGSEIKSKDSVLPVIKELNRKLNTNSKNSNISNNRLILPSLTSGGTVKSRRTSSPEETSKQIIDDSSFMIRLRKKIQNSEKLPNLPKPTLKKTSINSSEDNNKSLTSKIAKFKLTKFVSEERMRPLIQNPSPLSVIIPTAEPTSRELKKSIKYDEAQQILSKNSLFTTIYQRLNENDYSRIK